MWLAAALESVHALFVRAIDQAFRSVRPVDAGEMGADAVSPSRRLAGWVAMTGLALLCATLLDVGLTRVHPALGVATHGLVLAASLRFYPVIERLLRIARALDAGAVDEAAAQVSKWRALSGRWPGPTAEASPIPMSDRAPPGLAGLADSSRASARTRQDVADEDSRSGWIVSEALVLALTGVFRDLFAPLLLYFLLPGLIGPVLYRCVDSLRRFEQGQSAGARVVDRVLAIVDWLPLRASAAVFAIVGNFEDVVYAWHSAAGGPGFHGTDAMLVTVGGSALGVDLELGQSVGVNSSNEQAPEPMGEATATVPDAAALRSAAGLFLRALAVFGLLFVLGALAVAA
ncbi:MAG: regulatory signaling modulator protein AmpE [Burkholderiaceae bacterium]